MASLEDKDIRFLEDKRRQILELFLSDVTYKLSTSLCRDHQVEYTYGNFDSLAVSDANRGYKQACSDVVSDLSAITASHGLGRHSCQVTALGSQEFGSGIRDAKKRKV